MTDIQKQFEEDKKNIYDWKTHKAPKNKYYVNLITKDLINKTDEQVAKQVLCLWQNYLIGYAELGYIDHLIKNNMYNWSKAKKKHPSFKKTIDNITIIREFIRADVRITDLVNKYKD